MNRIRLSLIALCVVALAGLAGFGWYRSLTHPAASYASSDAGVPIGGPFTLKDTSGQVVTTVFYGQSNGTYEHYFRTFLRPEDVGWSVVEVVIIAVVVMITHCYYGYTASGGPVGVGQAVGRSMRFSLVSVVVVILLAQLALYGVDPNFNLTV